ncbi:ArsR/SmtB family transcription factor [Paenibacillus sp. WLX1005]|uniref:ArsR/SmtB family transcription factor n=1 Tax=unclassified Paenibacillus TaxID=185978 RepID=UPI00398444BF
MKDVLIIDELNQLRAVSDPFRVQLLYHLGREPMTGQQLAEKMDLSRSKIHYHLQELEKNGIIEVIRREEKNGILQKFYSPVAKAIIPSEDLLSFSGVPQLTKKDYQFEGNAESLQRFLDGVDRLYEEWNGKGGDGEQSSYEVKIQWAELSTVKSAD